MDADVGGAGARLLHQVTTLAPRRILFVCHAATAATRAARFPHPGEAIEARAVARVERQPFRLPRPDLCVASPMVAAWQTAAALGLSAVVEPALADLDHGRWAGEALDVVVAREPEAVAAWSTDPAAAPHGGESRDTLANRIGAWLTGQQEGQGLTIAVTHPAVIRTALMLVLGAPPAAFWRIDVAPLARAVVSRSSGRWTLSALGRGRPARE